MDKIVKEKDMHNNEEVRELKYALYARKSTEDENRQIRSIGDQIKECNELASRLGIKVHNTPFTETKSAKKPNQRPVFIQLLKDIKAKKFDGILCWHPDRLCRNMLEGGQIINMLDEGELKDIKFVSHQFSNDANGKMLLGMLFVFSKQYSDDLSDKVTRGVKGNFSEGKSAGTPKYGYNRDDVTGFYVPNEHYEAVKRGWEMRQNGSSIDEVVEYLIKSNVKRVTKNKANKRTLLPTKSTLSNVFKDPFYYGVLMQANQSIDLTEISNFQPMISRETYDYVQALGYGRRKDLNTKKRATFYPLRGMVYCAVCHSSQYMIVGKNKSGNGQSVLSYRCDNKLCFRKPKSLRAKHIFNSIYEILDNLHFDEHLYDIYKNNISLHTAEYITATRTEIHSNRSILTNLERSLNEKTIALSKLPSDTKTYKTMLAIVEKDANQKIDLEQKIKDLSQKIANPNTIAMKRDEFLNLIKSAPDKMKAGNAVEKDALARILFLNFEVDNEKIVTYLWNEPFKSMVNILEIQPGGGAWT